MSTKLQREISCPSAEDLAEYVDGGLAQANRAVVEDHLATCEDCFEQMSATLAFQAERTGGRGGRVDTRSRQRAWMGSWPLAAAASALLAFALFLALNGPGSNLETDPELAARLAEVDRLGGPAALARAAEQTWDEVGAAKSFDSRLSPEQTGFRLGVHSYDGAITLAASNEAAWLATLASLQRLLPASDAATAALTRLSSSTEREKRSRNLALLASLARKVQPSAFDLGLLVESARLAAVASSTETKAAPLLVEPETWSRLDDLRRIAALTAEPAVARSLATLAAMRPSDGVTGSDAVELAEACQEIILLY